MKADLKSKQRKGPIRIIVIQLARLGDTLQTLMALRAAKQLYPELEIHLVVRENFSAAVKRVPWIEKVIALPTNEILGPIVAGIKNEDQSLPFLAQWTRSVVDTKWDFLVNWSFSEPSSYLAALIPAVVKLGYVRGKDLSLTCQDDWSTYVQGVV